MAVIVIGDIEPDQAEKMIVAHFAQLKNPAPERPRDYTKIPTRSKSSGLVITDKEATNNVVMIDYPIHKAPLQITLGNYRDSLVRNLYTAMLGQRLQELTQQRTRPSWAPRAASIKWCAATRHSRRLRCWDAAARRLR